MLIGVLLISGSIIASLTFCLCCISKKETPKPRQTGNKHVITSNPATRSLRSETACRPARRRLLPAMQRAGLPGDAVTPCG
jgi:hypothetical protein